MDKIDIPRTLADLRKKGFVVPGMDKGGKAVIPRMPAMCQCPACGEKIPIFVQVQELTFAVSYPVKKEMLGRPAHSA